MVASPVPAPSDARLRLAGQTLPAAFRQEAVGS
jgi:hypothetical protein